MTRGKEQVQIFTDDKEELLKAIRRPDDPLSATALGESSPTKTEASDPSRPRRPFNRESSVLRNTQGLSPFDRWQEILRTQGG